MSGGFGTVVPCVRTAGGSNKVTEGDMILPCFGGHRRGDRIHEISLVTSPMIRDVQVDIGWQCRFYVGFLRGR